MERTYKYTDNARIDSVDSFENNESNFEDLFNNYKEIPVNLRRKFDRRWRNAQGLTHPPTNRKNASITTDDTMLHLMNSIGQHSLLTKEGEVYLAKFIEQAHQAPEDSEIYWQGKWAEEKLIVSNLRLVISIARKYVGKDNSSQFIDIFQDGTIGLMRAVKKFDWHKGFKFSTYATWWIKQSISRSSSSYDSTIKIPVDKREVLKRISNRERELESAGLAYNPKAIAEASYMETKQVIEYMRIQGLIRTSSIDKPINDAKGTYQDNNVLSDTLGENDENYVNIELQMSIQALRNVIQGLSARERDVVERRYGLNGSKPETLEAIGRANGVTREATRQIEKRVLLKIQKLIGNDELKSIID